MSTLGSSSPTPPSVKVHSQPFSVCYLLFHLCSLFRSTDPPPFPQAPLAALCRQFAGTFRSMHPALPLLFVLPTPSTVPSPSNTAPTLPPLFLPRALLLLYQRALHHTGPRLASLYRACCSPHPLSDGLFDAWQAFTLDNSPWFMKKTTHGKTTHGMRLRMFLIVPFAMCTAAAPRPKAIVLMLGDDYGYNNVGFAHGPLNKGNPEMRTPNLDRLAADGIVLERHYTYKYCSPTRSSLLSGRLATHVNQNNKNNDIEAKSGCDLRFKFLAQKMKEAGYYTAMVGKSHLGARSPANLPINRGFDSHLGFLKGGEDHYTQGSGSTHGEGKTVDLWEGHGPSNMTGIYSGYLYAHRAVAVISNFSSSNDALRRAGRRTDAGLFMYLAWHNTHTPLECPEEWMYPAERASFFFQYLGPCRRRTPRHCADPKVPNDASH